MIDKNNIKKYSIIFISVIIIILGIKVGYACTYVGKIVVTYPWDEFTTSEKIASYLMGYSSVNMTKQELYDKKLISKDQKIFQKFNTNYYENKSDTDINSNFKKDDLTNMYSNSQKYIDKEFNFSGKILTEIGLSEEQKQIIYNSSKTKDDAKETIDAISNMDKDNIMVKIDNTNVSVIMFCDKDKIDYTKWKKGTTVNVIGKIKSVTGDRNSETITLYDNPEIK
ncbi:hypothetical protein [Clostridium butyricum]|uniref:hypothetical protein n=1 Tax=Clostridium butyricum TaxID=1492 RepID=UPI00374F6E2D